MTACNDPGPKGEIPIPIFLSMWLRVATRFQGKLRSCYAVYKSSFAKASRKFGNLLLLLCSYVRDTSRNVLLLQIPYRKNCLLGNFIFSDDRLSNLSRKSPPITASLRERARIAKGEISGTAADQYSRKVLQ